MPGVELKSTVYEIVILESWLFDDIILNFFMHDAITLLLLDYLAVTVLFLFEWRWVDTSQLQRISWAQVCLRLKTSGRSGFRQKVIYLFRFLRLTKFWCHLIVIWSSIVFTAYCSADVSCNLPKTWMLCFKTGLYYLDQNLLVFIWNMQILCFITVPHMVMINRPYVLKTWNFSWKLIAIKITAINNLFVFNNSLQAAINIQVWSCLIAWTFVITRLMMCLLFSRWTQLMKTQLSNNCDGSIYCAALGHINDIMSNLFVAQWSEKMLLHTLHQHSLLTNCLCCAYTIIFMFCAMKTPWSIATLYF